MGKDLTPRILLLLAVAEMAWAQNQIAIPSHVTHESLYFHGAVPYKLADGFSADIRGWDTHPMAGFILIALAILFVLNLKLGPSWTGFRFWFALAALGLSVLPIDQIVIVAIPAFVLAVIAAVVDQRRRAVPAAPGKIPAP